MIIYILVIMTLLGDHLSYKSIPTPSQEVCEAVKQKVLVDISTTNHDKVAVECIPVTLKEVT